MTLEETSSILNIDTFSLQNDNQPQFEGRIRPGMILTGRTSGASARVTDVRLITDRVGTLIGSFRVPDVSDIRNPIFETGRSTFKLTNDPTNSPIEGLATTAGEEIWDGLTSDAGRISSTGSNGFNWTLPTMVDGLTVNAAYAKGGAADDGGHRPTRACRGGACRSRPRFSSIGWVAVA